MVLMKHREGGKGGKMPDLQLGLAPEGAVAVPALCLKTSPLISAALKDTGCLISTVSLTS